MQSDEDRQTAESLFLTSLEAYIKQVIKMNHGTKLRDVPKIVNDTFQRTMRANFSYHDSMSHAYAKGNDNALANYHSVMANAYKELIK